MFRKLKPVALLRREFLNERTKWRSRKAVTIYAGREAIYAMTEGNPRWLLGLLNDLVDYAKSANFSESETRVSYADQARILNNAARRLLSHIKASPFRSPPKASTKRDYTLLGFVDKLGNFFRNEILSSDFPLDPIGSFVVPDNVDPDLLPLLEQLLELGALVYVGNSPQDVPVRIQGSRFRLTYMLAPIYRLPLRLYRETSLDDVLSGASDEDQPELFT